MWTSDKHSNSGRRIATALVSLAVLATLNGAAPAAGADNPFTYMIGVNDCDVLKYNGEYYLSGNWLAGDMLASSDLRSWGRRTHVFSYDNSWHTPLDPADPDKDIHGTHLRYDNGVFYLYAHLDTTDGIVHATSGSIWGPYIEPVDSPFATWIDADTFRDIDGSLHFYSTRIASGQERIYRRAMSDLSTLTGSYQLMISPSAGWEGTTNINEGSKVFAYRDRYYMLYNARATTDPDYAIGCVEAATPTGFTNSGKYASAVLDRAVPGVGADEVTHLGQPWVVEGLNGFERWIGYFGQTISGGRTQRIDRLHFFGTALHVDGPTNRYSAGYHPGPARPQYLGLFDATPGSLPAHWSRETGTWFARDGEFLQTAPGAARTTLLTQPARHFLFELNLRLSTDVIDQQAGARVYYADDANFLIVGLHQTADSTTNNFYYHLRENGIDHVEAVPLATAALDLGAYQKLRIERNGSRFSFRLNGCSMPPVDAATASSFGAGRVGLYTNNATAAFDGVIYTIGWDEYDEHVTGWGASLSGVAPTGNWSTDASGLAQTGNAGGQTFKGDLMPTYEFAVQATDLDGGGGALGIFPVAIDPDNYLLATIDCDLHQLAVQGVLDGQPLATPPNASVPASSTYNLRAVKLSDRVILFVDGIEYMTIPAAYGPSQVGLSCTNTAARYNGILVYQTEFAALQSPWVFSDVGAVGFPGTATQYDGTTVLTASGTDIWTTTDAFSFLHQPIVGDVEVTARVRHHGMTDWWQKAGVMIRSGLAADAPHAATVLSAVDAHTGSATFCSRIWRQQVGSASGAHDLSIATENHPHWVRLERSGDYFASYSSTDGEFWTPVGAPIAIGMADPVNVGLVLTAHNNSRITDATFDHVRVLTPLPSPWTTASIGATAHAGRALYCPVDTGFDVDASGTEICCAADSLQFVSQTLPGDGVIEARVLSLEDTGPRAKAGVMIRESLQPGSRHFAVELHRSGLLGTNRRLVSDTGSGEDYASGPDVVPPYWLRLTRDDGVYVCEASPDGVTWSTVAGPYPDVFAGQPALAGLTACANSTVELCNARFDQVSVTISPRSADVDGDGDVDLHDVAYLQACFSGPDGGPTVPSCVPADFDYDDDVDVDDVARLSECLSGVDNAPAGDCGGSRAIRRYDQPRWANAIIACCSAILSRFAMPRLPQDRGSVRDNSLLSQNGRFSSDNQWPVLGDR